MFESIISNFLSSRLTQFVKHIDTENLKVGIWKGEVVLEDLELRSDCFEGLDSPFSLRCGYIGNLRIKIPWNSLTSKPVIIEIDKIHLILQPEECTKRKPDANYAALSKQASIAAAELAKRANAHASTSWRSNLVSRLLTRIISSIQVRVLDIHARVEFRSGIIGPTSFAAGVLIQEISSSSGGFAEKLFQVKGLGVYWDRDVEPTSGSELTIGDLSALFSEWGCNVDESSVSSSVHEDDEGDIFFVARSEDGGSTHQFLLHPFDLSLALRVLTPTGSDASSEAEKPKYEADVAMKAVHVSLEVGQMWDLLRLADWLQVSELRKSFRSLRPDFKVCESARAWWRYAISAVICQTKANSSTWAWSELRALCANRREYSRLYKLMLSAKASSLERLQLAALEGQLPVEQIMFSRAIAEDQIGKGHMQSSGERSWFRWGLRRFISPQTGGQGGVGDLEVEFTREEEDFLSNALEIAEQASGVEQLTAEVDALTGVRDIPSDLSSAQSDELSFGRPNVDLNAATIRWSQRKRSRRMGKFHGVSCEVARSLAATWFDRPRNSNSVVAIADISLSDLALTLSVRLPDNNNESSMCNFYNMQEIVTASLAEIYLRVNAGTEETKVTAKVSQLSVRDMLTQSSAFPCLISSVFPKLLRDDATNSMSGKVPSVTLQHLPVLDAQVLLQGGSTCIHIKIQPLEIVALPECVHALGAYFIPEYEAPFHENQVIAALNSIDDCPGRIQAKLAFLVEKMSHEVSLQVSAEKPHLIIPRDVLCADTALVCSMETLIIESNPYSWHAATQRAISIASKELASCADLGERQKQMQRMFFGELSLRLSGVRLFIGEAVPAVNSSFIAYRLANALKARGNSKGISPSNPQFSKLSNDILLPMELRISLLLSLLRSDSSMPLVYLKSFISNLRFECDLHFLAQVSSILEHIGYVSPQNLELRQKIKEQACRANMGKSSRPNSFSHQMARKREDLPTAAMGVHAETHSDRKNQTDDIVVNKDEAENTSKRTDNTSKREGRKPSSSQQVDNDNKVQVVDAGFTVGHTQNAQETNVQAQLVETEAQQDLGSKHRDQAKASRWWVLQWLKSGNRNEQTVIANPLAELPSGTNTVQGHVAIQAGHQMLASSQVFTDTNCQDLKDDKGSNVGITQESKMPARVPCAFKDSMGNDSQVENTPEQRSSVATGDNSEPGKSEVNSAPHRRWFQWSNRSQPMPDTRDPSGKVAEASNEAKERPGNSLLNRLKFLYPVASQGSIQELETDGDTDNLSRQRVVSLPTSTKFKAFVLVKSRGQRWDELSWNDRLRACLEVGDSGVQAPCECLTQDLPKLREKHSSSFIAVNLDEIAADDAVHLEAELSIIQASIVIHTNQTDEGTTQNTLEEQAIGLGLQLLSSSSKEPGSSSFCTYVVLRRHGVQLQTQVDDLVLFCGLKESVEAFSADACIISSRESGPESRIEMHVDPLAAVMEKGPFFLAKATYFEDGFTLNDGIRFHMSSNLRCLLAQLGLAEYRWMYSLAKQFSSRFGLGHGHPRHGQREREVQARLEGSGVRENFPVPSKLDFALGTASFRIEDPLSQNNWFKFTVKEMQCVIDTGHSAEDLAEFSVGYFGIYGSENAQQSWETILEPENHTSSEPVRTFHFSLQRNNEDRSHLEAFRKCSKALQLQQEVRCVPNLIQDRKLNLRSQLQDRKLDFRTQKRCVPGSSIVSLYVDHDIAQDRDEGLKLGQFLIDQGLLHKVPEHGKFEDSSALYRFFIDEEDTNSRNSFPESCGDLPQQDVVEDRFLLSGRIVPMRINVVYSICQAVSHTISIMDDFDSPNRTSDLRSLHTTTSSDSDLKQKLTRVFETFDVRICSSGLSWHVPAWNGSYAILGCYKEITLISNYYFCGDEHNREDSVGYVRSGSDASSRNIGTSSFETLLWSGNQCHRFCFKMTGLMLSARGEAKRRLIDSFDSQIDICMRPNGVVTFDTALSPGLRVDIDEVFLVNLSEILNRRWPHRSKHSVTASASSKDSSMVSIQSFFSGGYGFKLDFGGLDLMLPWYPGDERFKLNVKPVSCISQVLFKDCAHLPLDIIKSRASCKQRDVGGSNRDCSLLRSFLERIASADLDVMVDDLVMDTAGAVLFRGQSAAVRSCLGSLGDPSAGLVSRDAPDGDRSTSGSGDEWRLLRFAATWRPSGAGGDVALECRVGGFFFLVDSTAASALFHRLTWFSNLFCDGLRGDGDGRSQPECDLVSDRQGPGRYEQGSLIAGHGQHSKAGVRVESQIGGCEVKAHSGTPSMGVETKPAKFGGFAGGSQSCEWWADAVPGRCEVRLSTGEWQLVSMPQRIGGSTAQHLCVASRLALQAVAETRCEGSGHARRLKADLDVGVAVCWCDLAAAGALPYPATAGPCLTPSHMLLHLPSLALHLLLAGPVGSCDWVVVLQDGGGLTLTLDCEMGSPVEVRGSFADLVGVETAVMDALTVVAPLACLESRGRRAGGCPLGTREVGGGQKETRYGAPHVGAGAARDVVEARAVSSGIKCNGGEEHRDEARILASMLSSLRVTMAGVRIVLTECRRAGPAGGTLRLPLLDFNVDGVDCWVDAKGQPDVRCGAAWHVSCDYLNRGLGQWEPLLERWGCSVLAKTDVALADLGRGARSRVEVDVASSDHLNVNVSRAMLDVAMGVLAKDAKEWWTRASSARAGTVCQSRLTGQSSDMEKKVLGEKEERDKDAGADEQAGDEDAFYPLWIKNETGQRIILEAGPWPSAMLSRSRTTSPGSAPPIGQAEWPPGRGSGAWQQVEAGSMQPVTCVPLVSTPATEAGPGLPQVSLRQLRVCLASAPAAGLAFGDPASPASGPERNEPWVSPPDEGLDTGRMLHGCIDLDVPYRQAGARAPPLPGLTRPYKNGLCCALHGTRGLARPARPNTGTCRRCMGHAVPVLRRALSCSGAGAGAASSPTPLHGRSPRAGGFAAESTESCSPALAVLRGRLPAVGPAWLGRQG